jgi:hypothetical protein
VRRFRGVSASSSAETHGGVIDGATGFAGFQGYVIAKCDFQYAHGFSFIVGKYNSGSVFDVAHGYLALVIPDPSINARTAAAVVKVWASNLALVRNWAATEQWLPFFCFSSTFSARDLS